MRSSSLYISAAALVFAACTIWACSSSDTTGTPTGGSGGSKTEGGVGGKGGSGGTNVGGGGSSTGGSSNGGTAGTATGGTAGGGGSTGGTAGTATGGTAGGGGSTGGTAGTATGGTAGGGGSTTLPAGCFKSSAGTVGCNPLTNDKCDSAAGEACDYSENGLECFPAPNDVPIGGECSNSAGPYCIATAHCDSNGKCGKFCCADSDCTGGLKCRAISEADIGTLGTCSTPPAEAGTPCKTAEECGDVSTMICDPKGTGCQAGQCDGQTNCSAATDVCLLQNANASVGACMTSCVPFGANTCGANQQCMSYEGDLSAGACFGVGTGAADATCTNGASDVDTGCVANYACSTDGTGDFCRQLCNFWNTPTCTAADQKCSVYGACVKTGEATAIGGTCTGDDMTPCGLQDNKYKGVCYQFSADPDQICYQWCRLGTGGDAAVPNDCPGDAGLECTDVGAGSLGLCLAP